MLAEVCVVIPCHNGWKYTRECLASVLKSDYTRVKVILVDDGSTDATAEQAAEEFPSVQVIRGDGNLWWTGSMNVGIREGLNNGADYILVLNNDVVISENTIGVLVRCAETHPHAIIGSLIFDRSRPDLIWGAGGDLKWPWPGEVQLGIGQQDKGQFNGLREVKWTQGMGTLIRKEILLKLNLYDARKMPQYSSDGDFCLRARKTGHPTLVNSESRIFNNSENTGGIAFANDFFDGAEKKARVKMKWSDVKEIFISLRSPDHLSSRLVYMSRHCPWYLLPAALFIRYSRLALYILKRI